MSDSVNHPRTFEILTAEPVRRRRKPRDWSDDEKTRIVAAALQPRANVSAIARSEGLDPSQLYGWRRKALASGVVAPLTEETGKQIKFARVEAVSSGSVDIMVVRVGGAFDPGHLVRFCGRFARHDRFGCGGLCVVPAGRLPQGGRLFDGAGAGWRSRSLQWRALRLPVETGRPYSYRLVGRQWCLPLFENPGRSRLLLAGHIGGTDTS